MSERTLSGFFRGLLGVASLALFQSCCLFRVRPPVYEPVTLANGLVMQDLIVPESGLGVAAGDRVTIDYLMDLEDGTRVDSTVESGRPISFEVGLGQVPAGLDQGILGMRLFGSRRITVPPALGYGEAGLPSRIPADAVLVLEVELMELESVNRELEPVNAVP